MFVPQFPIVRVVGVVKALFAVEYHWWILRVSCRGPLQFPNCVEPVAFKDVLESVTVNGVPVRNVDTASNCHRPRIAAPTPLVRNR